MKFMLRQLFTELTTKIDMITIGECKNWPGLVRPIVIYKNGIEEGASKTKTKFIYDKEMVSVDPFQEMDYSTNSTISLFI